MRKNRFLLILLVGCFAVAWMGSHGTFPAYAKKKTAHKSKKVSSKRKTSSKKKTGRKSKRYYVKPAEENIRVNPKGAKIGTLEQGAAVTVNSTKGKWAYVTIRGWIWRPSLSTVKPKRTNDLVPENVDGIFQKKRFIIKGTLNNRTKAQFNQIILQGELFKGKKRVAFKTVTLFSGKKPLSAGKSYSFSIPFKRVKGFDSYSVRILKARTK